MAKIKEFFKVGKFIKFLFCFQGDWRKNVVEDFMRVIEGKGKKIARHHAELFLYEF